MPLIQTRQKKIVDTVSTFGAAERFLRFDADFVRWLGRAYNVVEIKSIDPEDVIRKYNLKGLVFGNYLTQEERYFYLFKISNQLEALSRIAGTKNLGKGMLIVSFGAHGLGTPNAVFIPSPTECIINLTRGRKSDYSSMFKGESSFVHEYGHFLDFIQGHLKDKALSHNFASENLVAKWENKTTLLFSQPIDLLEKDDEYMARISRSKYLKKRIEIFARLFEAAITHHIHANMPEFKKFFERTYTDSIYYPKDKIFKQKLDKKMIQILKIK